MLLRRDFRSLLAPGVEPPASLGRVADLPSNAIVEGGRLVGMWEFDPDEGRIAWSAFERRSREMEQAVALTGAFAREQLGDVRSFSLDTPKSRAPRIAGLRGE